MTEYDWPTTRAQAIFNFGGDAPRNDLEERIMQIFATNPTLVIKAIEAVTKNYHAGKIRSPWAILDLNLKEATRPGTPLTATDTTDKQKRITRAEQWIRNTGCHFDRESEVEDELFGDRGLLQGYPDQLLKQRMLTLWQQCRPEGERIEAEAITAAEKWKTWKQAEAAAKAKAADDLPL